MRLRLFAIIFAALLLLGLIYRFALPIVAVHDASKSEELHAVRSLPYASWVPADATKDKSGVTIHIPGRAFESLNFYNATVRPVAYLTDMDGTVVHTWAPKLKSVGFQHATLLPDGAILAAGKEKYLVNVAWDGSVLWRRSGRYHHDVSRAEDGTIYTLKRVERLVKVGNDTLPIIDDHIEVLSSDGTPRDEISIFDLVEKHVSQRQWEQVKLVAADGHFAGLVAAANSKGRSLKENSPFDVLHSNTVTPVTVRVPGRCEIGDLLISVRNVDLIGCVEPKSKKLRWSWGADIIRGQHHPQMLPNGHIIIFDNRPKMNKGSRAIVLDPQKEEIVWDTSNYALPFFYSASRGSASRFSNGNTLIVESDNGRAFEIDKSGVIVWEFLNPRMHKHPKTGSMMREAFYRVNRLHEPNIKKNIETLLLKSPSKS